MKKYLILFAFFSFSCRTDQYSLCKKGEDFCKVCKSVSKDVDKSEKNDLLVLKRLVQNNKLADVHKINSELIGLNRKGFSQIDTLEQSFEELKKDRVDDLIKIYKSESYISYPVFIAIGFIFGVFVGWFFSKSGNNLGSLVAVLFKKESMSGKDTEADVKEEAGFKNETKENKTDEPRLQKGESLKEELNKLEKAKIEQKEESIQKEIRQDVRTNHSEEWDVAKDSSTFKKRYLQAPGQNPYFNVAEMKDTDGQYTYYEFQQLTEKEAEFWISPDKRTQQKAINSFDHVLSSVCAVKGGFSLDATSITLLKKGNLFLEEDKWVVKKDSKCEIEFKF